MACRDQAGSLSRFAPACKAALERIVLQERYLERVKLVTTGEPLDRRHVRFGTHHRKRQAGVDPLAIHQHRTRPTLPVIASLPGAGEVQILSEKVEQRRSWRDLKLVPGPVDGEIEPDRVAHHLASMPRACVIASSGFHSV